MRVVVAPDSFKGSIGAAPAAAALATGWLRERPRDEVIQLPLADGGEGTLAVLAASGRPCRWHSAQVLGPGSEQVTASWLEFDGNEHVIELAAAAGLTQLKVLRPLDAHSYGVGELIGNALDLGALSVVVGLGGSACTDGGSGALAALGARFLDSGGRELPRGGGPLGRLATVDLTGLRRPPAGGMSCLTDVRAPLLGPGGAAAVFGPQKGAGAAEIEVLEVGLARLAEALGGDACQPGAGAAGGTGYGLAVALRARLLAGSAEIARIAGLPQALAGAGLIITGEGQFDASSLAGKVVGAVCAAASQAGVRVALVAGSIGLAPPAGTHALELTGLAGGAAAAMREPRRWLAAAGAELAARQPGAA